MCCLVVPCVHVCGDDVLEGVVRASETVSQPFVVTQSDPTSVQHQLHGTLQWVLITKPHPSLYCTCQCITVNTRVTDGVHLRGECHLKWLGWKFDSVGGLSCGPPKRRISVGGFPETAGPRQIRKYGVPLVNLAFCISQQWLVSCV